MIKIRKHFYFQLVFILFFLIACGPQLTINGDVNASKLIIDEKRKLMTIYVRLENTSNLPSNKLNAKFYLKEEKLAETFGSNIIPFSDYHGNLESFEISPNSGFFIAETYDYKDKIPAEQLINAVEVVIYNEDGEPLESFFIQNVEHEE